MMKSYFIFLISLSLCFSVYGNLKLSKENPVTSKQSYQGFVKRVSEIYDSLVFNNAKLTINNVTLKNIQSGIAFAYFDRKTTKRYILLNYAYLYRHLADFDSTKKSQENILKAIIAHEWAHHYLAHIFEGQSIINERNADIVAGRILAQNGVDRNSIKSLGALFSKYTDAQHLSFKTRNALLKKGYLTEEVITKGCNNEELKNLISNLKLSLNEENLDKLKVEYKIKIDSATQKFIDEFNQNLVKKEKEFRKGDSTSIISHPTIYYSNDSSKFILSKIIQDTIQISPKINYDLLLKDVNKDWKTQLLKLMIQKESDTKTIQNLVYNISDVIKRIDNTVEAKGINYDSDVAIVEMLYNRIYVESVTNKTNCKFDKYTKEEILKSFQLSSNSKIYKYNLIGVSDTITFDSEKRELTIEHKTVQSCQKRKTKNCPTQGAEGFPHTFYTQEALYYIDKNNHLWTETVGAAPIDDKIFLQRHNLK